MTDNPDASALTKGKTGPPPPQHQAGIDKGDVVIGAALLVIFAGAFLMARQWSAIAALFPQLATGIGAVLSAIFLARAVLRRRPVEMVPAATVHDPLAVVHEAEELAADQSEADRDFFASVRGRDWAVSMAFFAGFFVSLYVLGLYVTSVLFTVVYLRFQAKSSWLFSIIYAIVLTVGLYALCGIALKLPVPEGFFGLTGL